MSSKFKKPTTRFVKEFVPRRNIDEADVNGLFSVALSGNLNDIRAFISDHNISLSVKDNEGNTVLHQVLGIEDDRINPNTRFTIVNYLVENGAPLNHANKYNVTPLHIATKNQYHRIVKYLLDNGADPNAINSYKMTPLHIASRGQRKLCMKDPVGGAIIPKPEFEKREDISDLTKKIGEYILEKLREPGMHRIHLDHIKNVLIKSNKMDRTGEINKQLDLLQEEIRQAFSERGATPTMTQTKITKKTRDTLTSVQNAITAIHSKGFKNLPISSVATEGLEIGRGNYIVSEKLPNEVLEDKWKKNRNDYEQHMRKFKEEMTHISRIMKQIEIQIKDSFNIFNFLGTLIKVYYENLRVAPTMGKDDEFAELFSTNDRRDDYNTNDRLREYRMMFDFNTPSGPRTANPGNLKEMNVQIIRSYPSDSLGDYLTNYQNDPSYNNLNLGGLLGYLGGLPGNLLNIRFLNIFYRDDISHITTIILSLVEYINDNKLPYMERIYRDIENKLNNIINRDHTDLDTLYIEDIINFLNNFNHFIIRFYILILKEERIWENAQVGSQQFFNEIPVRNNYLYGVIDITKQKYFGQLDTVKKLTVEMKPHIISIIDQLSNIITNTNSILSINFTNYILNGLPVNDRTVNMPRIYTEYLPLIPDIEEEFMDINTDISTDIFSNQLFPQTEYETVYYGSADNPYPIGNPGNVAHIYQAPGRIRGQMIGIFVPPGNPYNANPPIANIVVANGHWDYNRTTYDIPSYLRLISSDYLHLIKYDLLKSFMENLFNQSGVAGTDEQEIWDEVSNYIRDYGDIIRNEILTKQTLSVIANELDDILLAKLENLSTYASQQIITESLKNLNFPYLDYLLKGEIEFKIDYKSLDENILSLFEDYRNRRANDLRFLQYNQVLTKTDKRMKRINDDPFKQQVGGYEEHVVIEIDYTTQGLKHEQTCYKLDKRIIPELLRSQTRTKINAKDMDGNTALHCSITLQHIPNITILLDKGAKYLNTINNLRRSPFEHAVRLYRIHNNYLYSNNAGKIVKKLVESFNKEFRNEITSNPAFKNNLSRYTDIMLSQLVIMINNNYFRYINKFENKFTKTDRDNLLNLLIDENIITSNKSITHDYVPLISDLSNSQKESIVNNGTSLHVLTKRKKNLNEKITNKEKQISVLTDSIANMQEFRDTIPDGDHYDRDYKRNIRQKYREKRNNLRNITNDRNNLQNKLNTIERNVRRVRRNNIQRLDRNTPINNLQDVPSYYQNVYLEFLNGDNRAFNEMWNQYLKNNKMKSPYNIHLVLVQVENKLLDELEEQLKKDHNKFGIDKKNYKKFIKKFKHLEKLYQKIIYYQAKKKRTLPKYLDENIYKKELVDIMGFILDHVLGENLLGTIQKLLYTYFDKLQTKTDSGVLAGDRGALRGYLDNIDDTIDQILDYEGIDDVSIKEYLIGQINPRTGSYEISPLSNNLIKHILELKENKNDYFNEGIMDIAKFFEKIKELLLDNQAPAPIKIDSVVIKYLDKYIIPFFKANYSNMITQMGVIINNYEKYLLNTHRNIQIINLMLKKIDNDQFNY